MKARQKLNSILRSPADGDEVFRALPIATADRPGEELLTSLHDDLLRVERYFSVHACSTMTKLNYGLPTAGAVGTALIFFAHHWETEAASSMTQFLWSMCFVLGVMGVLSAVLVWPMGRWLGGLTGMDLTPPMQGTDSRRPT